MDTYRTAGKGLYFLFIGQILALLAIIPFLGLIALVAGAVFSLYGLYTMSQADSDYQTAFILTIVNAAVSVVGNLFFKTGVMHSVMGIVQDILGFMIVYLICNTTGKLLYGISNALSDRASLLWKIYLVCTVIAVVCSLLSAVPILNILAALVGWIVAIVQLAASILYLIFIWKSQQTLQAYAG